MFGLGKQYEKVGDSAKVRFFLLLLLLSRAVSDDDDDDDDDARVMSFQNTNLF
jgi:hypothetical protein